MAETTSSRIRWDDNDLANLAGHMAQTLAEKPGMLLLKALRIAQAAVLAPERQREIKAWSVVQAKLDGPLEAAQAALKQGGAGPVCVATGAATATVTGESKETAVGQSGALDVGDQVVAGADADDRGVATVAAEGQTLAQGSAAALSPAAAALDAPAAGPTSTGEMGALLAGTFEAAMLVALQSPMVEEAFAKVLERAMARAAERSSGEGSRHDHEVLRTGQRVLLAGFPMQVAKGMEDDLRDRFDVRRWAPNQGPQMLQTLMRMCSVAVIPDEAEDEMSDAFRGNDMQVVRHTGNVQRLAERLSTLLS